MTFIYEGTNILASGAFLKCFSIISRDAEFEVATSFIICDSVLVVKFGAICTTK